MSDPMGYDDERRSGRRGAAQAPSAPAADASLVTGLLKDIALVLKIAGGLVGLTSALFFFRRMQWQQVRAIRVAFREPKELRSHLRLAERAFDGDGPRRSWIVKLEDWWKARPMKNASATATAAGVDASGTGAESGRVDDEEEELSAAARDTLERDWRGLHMRRVREKGLLRSILRQEPSGPVVVTGASGSGKSAMVREVLNDRPWTMYINLYQDPVGGSTDFLTRFVRACGYYYPPIELVALGILRQQITEHDAEKALAYTTMVLQQQRSLRNAMGNVVDGPMGVPFPVFCLDQMHDVPVPRPGASEADLARAAAFRKFVDWCVYVTDAKLAHVVFVTRPGLITAMDRHLALRFRREQVYMALMSDGMTKAYFRFQVNAELKRVGLPTLSEATIARVVATLGGNLKDIEHFLSAVLRGRPWKSVLRSMVRDSTFSLEIEMDDMLREAADERGSKDMREGFKKFLRFWALLKYMAESRRTHVPRRELISAVFLQASHELEDYVARGVLSHTDVAQHYYQNALLTEEKAALEAEALAEEAESGNPRRSDELDAALEQALRRDDAQAQQRLYAVQGGLDEHWLMPASPRLKVAMRKLVNDPRLKRLEREIAKKVLYLESRKRTDEVIEARRVIAAELESLGVILRSQLANRGYQGLEDEAVDTAAKLLNQLSAYADESAELETRLTTFRWNNTAKLANSRIATSSSAPAATVAAAAAAAAEAEASSTSSSSGASSL
ncbi:uncharacterized protein AMSG_01067 [Thecamonas trahens ATCC 50062]|uniref:Uncharacterized protein n=1 Tax=Thecamonas trahens ATCC 50062 TaxID=461836 RepID=A0A0L0DLG7_THETB|nr:hypothetical protein AMSG_01067 [Thecamonas trahens ATCC 50062]KNC52238.1 hypothetical protein AMSG_01067 [Thecamonas trahens ATCC 50062]|eukprot:XP_013762240.1 hypothetical protein AMSG_01067 [Thecamonas trahens ATCC 50062]